MQAQPVRVVQCGGGANRAGRGQADLYPLYGGRAHAHLEQHGTRRLLRPLLLNDKRAICCAPSWKGAPSPSTTTSRWPSRWARLCRVARLGGRDAQRRMVPDQGRRHGQAVRGGSPRRRPRGRAHSWLVRHDSPRYRPRERHRRLRWATSSSAAGLLSSPEQHALYEELFGVYMSISRKLMPDFDRLASITREQTTTETKLHSMKGTAH